MTEEKFNEFKSRWGSDTGRFVWNVYCYIYPKHPLFDKLDKEDIFGCPIDNFHGGCTYSRWARKPDGEITCKQYGCDYNHYQDEHFTFIENPEYATTVFADAEALFNELEGQINERV
jgi:hypothetical protein